MKTILDAIAAIDSDNVKARLFKGCRAPIILDGFSGIVRDVKLSMVNSSNINMIVNTMKDYGNVGQGSIENLIESMQNLGVETDKVLMNHTHKPADYMNNMNGVVSSVCKLCGQEIFATYWKTASERENHERRSKWYKSKR